MKYRVVKGLTLKKTELDSTHDDRGKASARAKTLRQGLRGSKTKVWVVDGVDGDPEKYQKPNVSRNY